MTGCSGTFFTEGITSNNIRNQCVPFIIYTKDVKSDGSCGYQAIANILDFSENGWVQVRRDMLTKLNSFCIYMKVSTEVLSV